MDFTRIFDGEKLISVLNFNNMIPVDDRFVTKIDLKPSQHEDSLVKKANKLYQLLQKPNCSGMLKRRCNDFKKLEQVLEKLLAKNKSK